MPVTVTLDRMLAARRMKAKDLARTIGISETQLSLFRSGKVRGVRFSTVAALCAALECTPGDLLGYEHDPTDINRAASDEG
jgi:putative transcriptional regulator